MIIHIKIEPNTTTILKTYPCFRSSKQQKKNHFNTNMALQMCSHYFNFSQPLSAFKTQIKRHILCCCCSVGKSCASLCELRTHGLQHARLPCPSPSPGVCSNSCPLSSVVAIQPSYPLLLPSLPALILC